MKLFKRFRTVVRHPKKENPRVTELQEQLESVAEDMEECKKKAQKLEERNAAHHQRITKLRRSIKSHRKRTDTVENERDSWEIEQEQLEKRVAQLEATLDSEIIKSEQEIKKINVDMEMKSLTSKNCSKAILKYCENQWRNVDEAIEKIIDAEECLQKVVEQVAGLNSAVKQQELKSNKIKWKLHKRSYLQLATLIKLENALMQCEENKKSAEYKRDKLMRDQKRLKDHIVHLEAMFAFENNTLEQEGQKSKTHIEEEVTYQKGLFALRFCEEQQNSVVEVGKTIMDTLGHLQKTEQQASWNSDLSEQELESNESTWNMEEISRLQMKGQEEMGNSVALLEFTLNNMKYICQTPSL